MHTHSSYSEDSETPLEQMIQRAEELGIEGIAITEHVDFNPADRGYLFFEEDSYSKELEGLRRIHSRGIQILKGVEFDAPHLYREQFHHISKGDYDVILGSVHMIDDKFVGDNSLLERMSLDDLFNKYYKQLLDLVRFGGFDVLAHFDFPKRYYRQNILSETMAEKILRTMIEGDIALEINTSPLRKGYRESSPGQDIVQKYADLGGRKITIGSDAHIPEDIVKDFDFVFRMLSAIPSLRAGYYRKRNFTGI